MSELTVEGLSGGKPGVLSQLVNDPEFLAQRFHGIGNTSERAAVIAQQIVRGRLFDTIKPELQTRFDAFVGMNGPRPVEPSLAQDEWDSALDDDVAATFEPYSAVLSADWLGEKTVDTRLYSPGELDKLCAGFAKEAWRQLTYQKNTTAKILSAVGIVQEDIAAFLKELQPAAPTTELEPDMAMNAVLNKIMLFVGNNEQGKQDLGIVMNDAMDEFIVAQANLRLGIDMDDVETLRMAGMAGHTLAWMQEAIGTGELLDEADSADAGPANVPGGVMSLAPGTVPGAPATGSPLAAMPGALVASGVPGVEASPLPAARPGRKPRAKASGPVAGQVSSDTLTAFKNHANIKDQDAADALGVSRATYNNFVAGKTTFTPTDAQRTALRTIVTGHVNGLLEALTMLDGEPHDLIE